MSDASPKRRVAVLFGGRSAEHEISCISARSVIDALDPERNDVVAIGITKEGRWHLLPGPPALPAESGRMPEVTDDAGRTVELATEGAASELVTGDGAREPIDVVFPVLHGPMGEDGAVQGMFELAGVPYVGRRSVWGPRSGWTRRCRRCSSPRRACPCCPGRPCANRTGRRIQRVSPRVPRPSAIPSS